MATARPTWTLTCRAASCFLRNDTAKKSWIGRWHQAPVRLGGQITHIVRRYSHFPVAQEPHELSARCQPHASNGLVEPRQLTAMQADDGRHREPEPCQRVASR